MKKFIALLAVLLSVHAVFCQENSSSLMFNMNLALENSDQLMSSDMRRMAPSHCVGRWKFKNGSCSTLIECRPNGTMQIIQFSKGKTVMWVGNYTVKDNHIYFHTIAIKTKLRFYESISPAFEVWKITYILKKGGMYIYSSSIPNDESGIDFSVPRKFKPI